jgi:uncharacterized membrane-anchored protein
MRSPRVPSDSIVISAPMSFVGSAQRIWPLTRQEHRAMRSLMTVLATVLIILAWAIVLFWYCIVGFLVVPYRLVRREERRRKRDEMRLLESRRATRLDGATGTPG